MASGQKTIAEISASSAMPYSEINMYETHCDTV